MRPIRIVSRVNRDSHSHKSSSKPKNVRFIKYRGDNFIVYNWGDETVRDRIIIRQHEHRVGYWGRTIYIDDDIPERNAKAIALHESVEKHLMNRGVPYQKAHNIALKHEHDYLRRKSINIRSHEQIVRRVREKEEVR